MAGLDIYKVWLQKNQTNDHTLLNKLQIANIFPPQYTLLHKPYTSPYEFSAAGSKAPLYFLKQHSEVVASTFISYMDLNQFPSNFTLENMKKSHLVNTVEAPSLASCVS